MSDPKPVLTTVRKELERAREGYEEEQEKIREDRDCPHCERVMELGAMGGGEITFGCYPPHGERDEYDCPYYVEQGFPYSITRKTGAESKAQGRYEALLDLCHQLAIQERRGVVP